MEKERYLESLHFKVKEINIETISNIENNLFSKYFFYSMSCLCFYICVNKIVNVILCTLSVILIPYSLFGDSSTVPGCYLLAIQQYL